MKVFAVLPDNCSKNRLDACLPDMSISGVHYLYLRNIEKLDILKDYVDKVNQFGIIPVVSHEYQNIFIDKSFGIHYKSSEPDNLKLKRSGCAIVTASAHNSTEVRNCFSKGADFVYLSPVFKPISKPGDNRPVIPFEVIEDLTGVYGEKVILLGGITPERISQLKQKLKHDFSIGGISMYFNAGSAGDDAKHDGLQ